MTVPRRSPLALVLLLLGLGTLGCARDHGRITPTTSGTDLRNLPRGRMTPQPFPGSDLARNARPAASPLPTDPGTRFDPAAIVTAADKVEVP